MKKTNLYSSVEFSPNKSFKDLNKTKACYSQLLGKEESKKELFRCNQGPTEDICKRPAVTSHKVISRVSSHATLKPLNSLKGIKNSAPEGTYSRKRLDIAYIEPKIYEPFNNDAGHAPRKVLIDRKVKQFSALDMHEALLDLGVDFANAKPAPEQILKLEWFDDSFYEVRLPMDYITLAKGGQESAKDIPDYFFDRKEMEERLPLTLKTSASSLSLLAIKTEEATNEKGIPALAIVLDDEETGVYRQCLVYDYDEKTECYFLRFDKANPESKILKEDLFLYKERWVHKLFVVFNIEDKLIYAQRLFNAVKQRREAYELIQFNFYVDNMPVKGGQLMLEEHTTHILQHLESKSHDPFVSPATQKTLRFAQYDYARTMNKMVFINYMVKLSSRMLYRKVDVPSSERIFRHSPPLMLSSTPALFNVPTVLKQKPNRDAGKVDTYLSYETFTQRLQRIKLHTLYVKEEVVLCMIKVKKICEKLEKHCIYHENYDKVFSVDQFVQHHKNAISSMKIRVRETLEEGIKANLTKELANVGKGWFNLHEEKESYYFSKLKKLLSTIKYMTQQTLHTICTNSVRSFYSRIKSRLPDTTTITNSTQVDNIFSAFTSKSIAHEDDAPELPEPLLSLELQGGGDEADHGTSKFYFNADLDKFEDTFTNEIFKKGVETLSSILPIDRKLLEDFFKSDPVVYLSAPKLGAEQPHTPTEEERKKGKIPDENLWLWQEFRLVQTLIKQMLQEPKTYLGLFKRYENELEFDPEIQFEKTYGEESEGRLKYKLDMYLSLLKSDMELDEPEETEQVDGNEEDKLEFVFGEITADVTKHYDRIDELTAYFPDTIRVGIFQISCKEIKTTLVDKHTKYIRTVFALIYDLIKYQLNETHSFKDELIKELKRPSSDIRNLTEMRKFVTELPLQLVELNKKIDELNAMYSFLDENYYEFSGEDIFKKFEVWKFASDIYNEKDKKEINLDEKKVDYKKRLEDEQLTFDQINRELEENVMGCINFHKVEMSRQAAELISGYDVDMKKNLEKASDYNEQESLFGVPATSYQLKNVQKVLENYKGVWVTFEDWKKKHKNWLEDDWNNLNGEDLQNDVQNMKSTINKSKKYFKNKKFDDESHMRKAQDIVSISENLFSEIEEFDKFVPIAVCLRTQGMEQRHWEWLSKETGIDLNPSSKGFNFSKLIDLGLVKFMEQIEDVSTRALKEHGIRKELDKIKADWGPVEFEFTKMKNTTDIDLIKNFEDCVGLSDEHLGVITNLFYSPYKKVFEEEIQELKEGLEVLAEVMEYWIKLQVSYMYLQPIFTSDDIQAELPQYYKMFKQVDSRWKRNTADAKAKKSVYEVCKVEKLKTELNEDLNILDKVTKNLEHYLNIKKQSFQRLYFLSDDELLKILSNTKEPRNINDYLRKIFESMEKIIFNDSSAITHMCSKEGEKVRLVRDIVTKGKSVEIWCKELEMVMVDTVRDFMNKGVAEYAEMNRVAWVKKQYGQCVLNGTQVWWTKEAEEAIQKHKLQQYYDKTARQILDLVETVRTKLTKLEKKNISPLIVQGVHERDIINEINALKVHSVFEYEWIKQLRFYMEDIDLFSRCMQTSFPYGYEYMGNADRLVITPLTDKCYMTLMGALKLNLGGAPAGPAGTGKTETTKDLSKNLAKLCKVFNCGPEMEYKMIGTFFKGLTSSGAWVCFDEFNRILLEVLSVIAQYLQILLDEKKKGERETQCEFLGQTITVVNTFNVYITMNPTYAGRQALPDNLKALFRPVAMMVPDYGLIAEIFFYSFGFVESNTLAGKMVGTFQLCSEQLSKQDHYDYGMRAVRSTINAAGLLKRELPDEDEAKIVLKAVMDINLPKFLKNDIPLFRNILSDLFPGVKLGEPNLGRLKASVESSITELNLDPVPSFVEKIWQLYDTMNVRHGLMLVGPTGSGKTANYRVLQHGINKVAIDVEGSSEEELAQNTFRKVTVRILNPKSILNEQIYGQLNQITKEYTKGLVPVLFNKSCDEEKTEGKQWIMFDGPVDALWIESMNSVLDDSKKLCLPNSEIIDMTGYMTVMFETDDLSEASPATISRCGMVYMDPKALGYACYFINFRSHFPEALAKTSFVTRMKELYEGMIEELLFRMRRECNQTVLTSENNYIFSLLKLVNSLVAKANPDEYLNINAEFVAQAVKSVDLIFVYAAVWSIGGNLDAESRINFNTLLTETVIKANAANEWNVPVPADLTYYDYTIDIATNQFVHWKEVQKEFTFNPRMSFDEIIVPTEDSTKYIEISASLLKSHYHVLKCGGTGTGKSLNCDSLMYGGLFPDTRYTPISLTFSARTNVMAIHQTIGPKLKRRKMGVLGPDNNKKGLVMVDDLNMPKKEVYGAQPVLELLRQWYDYGGWYDMLDFEFKLVVDLFVLSAMGMPGGGRSIISNRLVRHSNVIAYTNMTDASIMAIYKGIVAGFYEGHLDEVKDLLGQVVTTTLHCYNEALKFLLPIPKKSHYLFNLRDIAKIFQGVCNARSSSVPDTGVFIRLWVHEMNRVYRDRLLDKKDLEDFDKLIRESVNTKIEIDSAKVFDRDLILFGDFMEKDQDNRVYKEIESLKALETVLYEFLEEYNGENNAMNLILFSDACEHISRTCRVLSFPKGNSLLMGVGGSGRQSCCKLANYVLGYKIFQIEITKDYKIDKNWKEDVKKCLLQAGAYRQPTTFLIVDTQIVDDKQLEDLNGVLNTGDVPNLYEGPDFAEMDKNSKKDCQEKGIEQTPMNLFNMYLVAVRKNTHIVMAMSPMSEKFRANLMMFPSLVNCTTIDYYSEWPQDALLSVANEQLAGKIDLGEYQSGVESMFSVLHKSVEDVSAQMIDELKRYNYVTPTSYLELIRMYKQVLQMKRSEFQESIDRYEQGLSIIQNAQVQVDKLSKEIKAKEPELEQMSKDLAEKDVFLQEEVRKTNETSAIVAAETDKQNIEVAEVTKKKKSIEEEKREVEQDKKNAIRLAESLNKGEIGEVAGYSNPPAPVAFCMKLINMLFDKDKLVKNKEDNKEIVAVAKKELLSNISDFIKDLVGRIKGEIITENQFKKIEPFYDELCKTDLKAASSACGKLGEWVKAMKAIYIMKVKLAPILEELSDAESKLKVGQEKLNKLNAEKAECEAKVKKLKDEAEETTRKKNETEYEVEQNKLKLQRAKKLLTGLADEKTRWEEEVKSLKFQMGYLVGNCIIAAGMMSYGGPFDSNYRHRLMKIWIMEVNKQAIPMTDDVSLIGIAGKKVTIEGWKGLYGLPDDDLSIENAIMLTSTKRWPLCIDPQGQANSFIRKMGHDEKAKNFEIIKATDEKISAKIEAALKFNKWVLVEGVTEKLSPELEPVLVPQLKVKGKNVTIRFGEKEIDYNDKEFKFFMTTTIPNPHYSPETCVKICLINFAITESGLKDQMLSLVVSLEKADLEQERNNLIESNARAEKTLKLKEDEILADLKNSDPATILNEDHLINKLYNTKAEATKIKQDQEKAKLREEEIRIEREKYTELSKKTSLLFFTLTDMASIDHMYQYSLVWYKYQFEKATEGSEPCEDDDMKRIDNIYMHFLKQLYVEVSRTLFDKDKLLFSFNMVMRLMLYHKRVDAEHFKYLLTGYMDEVHIPENVPDYLDEITWSQMYKTVYGLKFLKRFEGFIDYFAEHVQKFKAIYTAEDPRKVAFPGEWQEKLDPFQKLLVYKAIRPDYVIQGIKEWIKEVMDPFFVNPPLFNIEEGYKSSTKETPIIFIITPGSDPLQDLKQFTTKKTQRDLDQISLGQGQGPIAQAKFNRCSNDGQWLFFQNTHLYIAWMPNLEKMIEVLKTPETNDDFRLFLTTASVPDFPVSILQDGIKMTVESTGDVKQMMLNAFQKYPDEFMNSCKNPQLFKNLLFGCTLFHALLIDRKKFGPIGWTSPTYDFSDTDLEVTKDQLKMMVNDQDEMQFTVIRILAAVINYGGRVTDDKDERFIKTLVDRFLHPDMVTNPQYSFDDYGLYKIPEEGLSQADYLALIKDKYDKITPELFGLHANADITTNSNKSDDLLTAILSIQPKTASGKSGKSPEDLNEEKALQVQAKVPALFDLELLEQKYPTDYNESMNTVLTQECQRYNTLIKTMNSELALFMKANRGRIVMNPDLEKLGVRMMTNEVPFTWTEEKGCGFLSIKPLSNWLNDLINRIKFLKTWENEGTPKCFWVSGFFFPQAFLTGMKQNYARKHQLPIDVVEFDFEFQNHLTDPEAITAPAPEGGYISGLFLEGCAYDDKQGVLVDSLPRKLYSEMPIMWLKPFKYDGPKKNRPKKQGIYKCPVYKTLARYGTLSTTGHSTNFVMFVDVPTKESDEKWVKAGAALFTSLKFD